MSAQVEDTCSYHDCALLRVGDDVLAGSSRALVASFGAFDPPDLDFVGRNSGEASALLQVTEDNYRSGKVMGWLGFTMVAGGWFAFRMIDEPGEGLSGGEWASLGVGVTGAGLVWWGNRRLHRATRAFDEAIWWYNGTLRRPR